MIEYEKQYWTEKDSMWEYTMYLDAKKIFRMTRIDRRQQMQRPAPKSWEFCNNVSDLKKN